MRLSIVENLVLGACLALVAIPGARSEELPSESDVRTRIQTLLLPSPYRISPGARQGTIQYRLGEGATVWHWPETGEQRVSRTGDVVELTVCRDCGNEPAPTPEELSLYRQPNRWLQSADRSVVKFARAARGGSVDSRMRHLVAAVQKQLSGPVSYRRYESAREALASREGDCTEYALLLAAAGRARGIPTRVVAGLAYGSRFVGKSHVFGPHMWVQAWNGRRWVSYDAGLGEFDAGHLALAVGDGSPESLRGVLDLIPRLRILDAAGLVPSSRVGATR